MTINCMWSTFYGAAHTEASGFRLPLAPSFCAHQHRLFIISLVFLFIAFSAKKKKQDNSLALAQIISSAYIVNDTPISTIPIATIPMDKIASSFARNNFHSSFFFVALAIHNENNLWKHCARALLSRFELPLCIGKRDSNSHYTRANVQNAVKMNNSYMCTIKMNSTDQAQSEQQLLKTNAS